MMYLPITLTITVMKNRNAFPFLLAAAMAAVPAGQGQSYTQRVAAAVQSADSVARKGPFQPSWDSLVKYSVPQWYLDGKFGIFIHWGAYSVPAFGNEWYPREMYRQGTPIFRHHVATFGPQAKFGYKDFLPRFTAAKFDADGWASLFERAGAKFVVPVAEHHDGFPMYDCSFTEWSAAKMGPKRDVVGELAKAVPAHGMVFGASSHRAEHWWFYDEGMKFDSDVKDQANAGLYGPAQPQKTADGKQSQPNEAYLNDWLARTTELVDKYHPQLLWFDWWIEQPVFQPYLQRFAAFYYNRGAEWNKGVAINYKNKSFPEKAAVLDIERGKLDKLRELYWQTDTSIGLKSWGYIEGEEFRSVDSLVDDLVDIVSKNGALLLNIGPRADGTIPEEAQQRLLGIGKWLAVNGEAIYGTRPWKVYGEGPTQVLGGGFTDRKSKPFTAQDVRFTTKGGALYAIALAWPEKELTIRSLGSVAGKVTGVTMLGAAGGLKFKQGAQGLTVSVPGVKTGDYAFVFKVAMK
jgi:alpha-L-fucosidase